ncbi:MAG: hypothetical protein PHT94_00605 [Candidatus Nanoarchaeia archaeon]|nr:hypothetical protein [Candidatus Nanoarchaeia archaeon]
MSVSVKVKTILKCSSCSKFYTEEYTTFFSSKKTHRTICQDCWEAELREENRKTRIFNEIREIDAAKWAEEFCKFNSNVNLDTMRGWFANSIMAGYDEAICRSEKKLSEFRALLHMVSMSLSSDNLEFLKSESFKNCLNPLLEKE